MYSYHFSARLCSFRAHFRAELGFWSSLLLPILLFLLYLFADVGVAATALAAASSGCDGAGGGGGAADGAAPQMPMRERQ